MTPSQLDHLATWAQAQAPPPSTATPQPGDPPVASSLAIASGKGGVGKTTVAVNLAWQLAASHYRVLLIDADFGCANTQCYFTVEPTGTIADALRQERTFSDLVVPCDPRVPTLHWLPGMPSAPEWAHITPQQLDTLEASLQALLQHYDWVLWDLGAGITPMIVSLAQTADAVLVVTQAEQPAIFDAYGLMKALHQVHYTGQQWTLCNRVSSLDFGQRTLDHLQHVASQVLHESWTALGSVRADPAVSEAVQRHVPVVAHYPRSWITQDLAACRRRLTHEPLPPARGLRGLWSALVRR